MHAIGHNVIGSALWEPSLALIIYDTHKHNNRHTRFTNKPTVTDHYGIKRASTRKSQTGQDGQHLHDSINGSLKRLIVDL